MARTQSKEVNLTKRVQTPKGMRYCPVVLSPNGRVKPDLVLVDDKPEKHPEGAYYLEWREKGKRVRLSVGKDAQDAAARRQRKEAELNALNNGVSVLPEKGNGHKSVAAAVAQFLEETEITKKPFRLLSRLQLSAKREESILAKPMITWFERGQGPMAGSLTALFLSRPMSALLSSESAGSSW